VVFFGGFNGRRFKDCNWILGIVSVAVEKHQSEYRDLSSTNGSKLFHASIDVIFENSKFQVMRLLVQKDFGDLPKNHPEFSPGD
jgi:hypothetical protein